MSFEMRIARRYLRSKQRTGFISYTTYVSVFGVVLGVAALIISLSVLNGFETVVKQKFFNFDGQIHVLPASGTEMENYRELEEALRKRKDVAGVMSFISGKGMLASEKGQTGIVIRGIDARHMDRALSIQEQLFYGSSFFIRNDSLAENEPVILTGSLLADRMEIDVGDKASLISARITGGILSAPPNLKVVVDAIFGTGIYEYDNLYVIVSLNTARKLFGFRKGVSGIVVKARSVENIVPLAEELRKIVPAGIEVKTWFEMHRSLYTSMKIEQLATFIVLSLIIVVAAFNIISSLIMMVLEKKREIGILRSMGCPANGIVKIFVLEGAIVGTIGLLAGLIVGYGLCWAQLRYGFIRLPGDIFIIDVLPVVMKMQDGVFVILTTIIIYLAASLYPAWKASQLDPLGALRYE